MMNIKQGWLSEGKYDYLITFKATSIGNSRGGAPTAPRGGIGTVTTEHREWMDVGRLECFFAGLITLSTE